MAFFNIGLMELVILGVMGAVGLGALIAVCIAVAGGKKKDED